MGLGEQGAGGLGSNEESLLQPGIWGQHSPGSSSCRSAARTTLKIQILGLTRLEKNQMAVQGAGLWSHTHSWNLTQQEFLLCSAFPTSALRKNLSWNAAE